MKQYQDLLEELLEAGTKKEDRTGTGTLSIFGYQMRFDLAEGFPMLTGKRVPFKPVLSELLWFLSGSTNVNDLRAILHGEEHRNDWSKKTIWDANATSQGQALGYEDGELGPVYGSQWRKWKLGQTATLDQIGSVIKQIQSSPDSRRLIVTAWNPAELFKMALPPCHCLFQFYVANGKLSCQLYQRSADVFLGVPFNIASYALLTHMIANICNLRVGEFIWTGGDTHLYSNHIEQAEQYLKTPTHPLPKLAINPEIINIDQYTMNDFELVDYVSGPTILAPMAV